MKSKLLRTAIAGLAGVVIAHSVNSQSIISEEIDFSHLPPEIVLGENSRIKDDEVGYKEKLITIESQKGEDSVRINLSSKPISSYKIELSLKTTGPIKIQFDKRVSAGIFKGSKGDYLYLGRFEEPKVYRDMGENISQSYDCELIWNRGEGIYFGAINRTNKKFEREFLLENLTTPPIVRLQGQGRITKMYYQCVLNTSKDYVKYKKISSSEIASVGLTLLVVGRLVGKRLKNKN